MMPHTVTREELYFVPIDDDHCYVLSCYSVNGVTSAEDKALLRAALTSFTPDESLRWTTEQRFQYEIDCLEHGTGVELTLLSGQESWGAVETTLPSQAGSARWTNMPTHRGRMLCTRAET